jgi:hypothetical protein
MLSSSIADVGPEIHQRSPWIVFHLMATYAVFAVLMGGVLSVRRDA